MKGDIETQFEEYKGAKVLRGIVDNMISRTDKIIADLQKDREQLQKNIDITEVKLKYENGGKQELQDTLLERK